MEVRVLSRARKLLFMHYFIGAIIVIICSLFILKTEWFVQNFGTVAWAEEHLGTSGGTRLFYKLLGLIGIFIGFIVLTNMWQGFLMATIGKIFIR